MAAEAVSKVFNALAHPNDKEPIEHNASHGASLVDHEPPQGLLNKVTSSETTRLIQSQGNNGVGMEDGLQKKAIDQQERVAERSRLQAEGMFVPHVKHDDLVNYSQEHQNVAQGSKLFTEDDSVTSSGETKLV